MDAQNCGFMKGHTDFREITRAIQETEVMDEKTVKEIEALFKEGKYAEAEEQLKRTLEANPDDRQVKMLYGTCRMLQGDTETADKIHSELEEYYKENPDVSVKERTFWQKYHRWIIYGAVAALVVVGGAVAFGTYCIVQGETYYCKECGKPTDIAFGWSENKEYEACVNKYGGPPQTYYCQVCGQPTKIAFGWGNDNEAELQKKVDSGLIPCKNCGKDTPYRKQNEEKQN